VTALVGCGDDSDLDEFEDETFVSSTGSGGSADASLFGVWQLTTEQAEDGNVTISFRSDGRGAAVIDVPGFEQETRGYSFRQSGDQIFFTYDDVGVEGTPSTILELTTTTLRLSNPDNTTGVYSRVGSS